MFVCLCKAVSDVQVVETIRSGACTLKQVADSCGAGSGCGACTKEIQDMIEDEVGLSADQDAG